MVKAYLLLNAVLYFALVLWCTFRHEQASQASGFVTLNHSGHSEYLVIYGGLQLGLAIFYAYLASSMPLHRAGVMLSLMLYGPIVIYRIVTVIIYSPVGAVTWATGALEGLLLIGAIVLYFRTR